MVGLEFEGKMVNRVDCKVTKVMEFQPRPAMLEEELDNQEVSK